MAGLHYHPIYCILPPHMLEHLSQNGTSEQREAAARTVEVSTQIRQQRTALLATGVKPMAAGSAGGVKNRKVYNTNHTTNLPGQLVRNEGDPASGDAATDEAYDGAGYTYDLYWDVYQRNSVDGNGLELDSTVHYGQNYDNAFWNGSQMVYGDGDEGLPPSQQLFNRFTIAVDVIGHELTHGVTQYTAGLVYANQPGALNESISDVFGSLVKQRHLGQTAAQADWIIGEGLFTPNVHGVGIRSMKAPGTAYDDPVLGKDPQPANMSGYVNTTSDNGGVHINSGIPNHAFYVIAINIGGNAWEKAGQIWYAALKGKFTANTDFQGAADLTYAAAGELYGVGGLEQQAVQNGWAEVGITVGGGGTGGGQGCLASLLKLFSPSPSGTGK